MQEEENAGDGGMPLSEEEQTEAEREAAAAFQLAMGGVPMLPTAYDYAEAYNYAPMDSGGY